MFASLASIFKPKDHKVLIIGTSHSGKTTLLYQIKLGQILQLMPTMGFNVENIQLKKQIIKKVKLPVQQGAAPTSNFLEKSYKKKTNVSMNVWDIGGTGMLYKLFPHYYPQVEVLLYVIDVKTLSINSQSERVENDVKNFLEAQELPKTASIMFVINKIDLLEEQKLTEQLKEQKVTRQGVKLQLEEILDKITEIKDRDYCIQFCSAYNKESVDQIFDWVCQQCLK